MHMEPLVIIACCTNFMELSNELTHPYAWFMCRGSTAYNFHLLAAALQSHLFDLVEESRSSVAVLNYLWRS